MGLISPEFFARCSDKQCKEKLPRNKKIILVAKLSSKNAFHQALIKELERLQATFVPTLPVTPPTTGGSGENEGPSETSAQRGLRLAKADAIKELMDYKIETDYSSANWTIILNLKTIGKNTINSAKTTTEVSLALDNAKAEVDKVQTISQGTLDSEKVNAIAILTSYKTETDYSRCYSGTCRCKEGNR